MASEKETEVSLGLAEPDSLEAWLERNKKNLPLEQAARLDEIASSMAAATGGSQYVPEQHGAIEAISTTKVAAKAQAAIENVDNTQENTLKALEQFREWQRQQAEEAAKQRAANVNTSATQSQPQAATQQPSASTENLAQKEATIGSAPEKSWKQKINEYTIDGPDFNETKAAKWGKTAVKMATSVATHSGIMYLAGMAGTVASVPVATVAAVALGGKAVYASGKQLVNMYDNLKQESIQEQKAQQQQEAGDDELMAGGPPLREMRKVAHREALCAMCKSPRAWMAAGMIGLKAAGAWVGLEMSGAEGALDAGVSAGVEGATAGVSAVDAAVGAASVAGDLDVSGIEVSSKSLEEYPAFERFTENYGMSPEEAVEKMKDQMDGMLAQNGYGNWDGLNQGDLDEIGKQLGIDNMPPINELSPEQVAELHARMENTFDLKFTEPTLAELIADPTKGVRGEFTNPDGTFKEVEFRGDVPSNPDYIPMVNNPTPEGGFLAAQASNSPTDFAKIEGIDDIKDTLARHNETPTAAIDKTPEVMDRYGRINAGPVEMNASQHINNSAMGQQVNEVLGKLSQQDIRIEGAGSASEITSGLFNKGARAVGSFFGKG